MIERTLVLIKPDGVQRGLIGEIIKRFEQRGLKIVGMKLVKPTATLLEKQYPASMAEALGKKTLEAMGGRKEEIERIFGSCEAAEIGSLLRTWLIEFMSSSPVVAIVIEGAGAISMVRKIVGATDPSKAQLGTIRGDLTHLSIEAANFYNMAVRNLIHASGSREEAEREIGLWFSREEIRDYKRVDESALGLR
jgi:nucleoside-diphosphate kinase